MAAAFEDLSRKLLAVSTRNAAAKRTSTPIRVETEISAIDPLSWLRSLNADRKVYWRDREQRFEFAGIGEAHSLDLSGSDSLAALDTLSDTLMDSGGDIRYIGGLRFDSLNKPGERDLAWQAFGQGWLTLPRVTLTTTDTRHTLACNLMPHETTSPALDRIAQYVHSLRVDTSACEEAPTIVTRTDSPEIDLWRRTISTALQAIADDRCQKVVPARRTDFALSAPIDPWRVLAYLRAHSDHQTLFGLQPIPGTAFIGATPERLYRRNGMKLESEALAGSRKRGAAPEIDAVLARELLTSAKDRREHGFVVNSLRAHLCTICENLEIDSSPEVLTLANIMHLKTRIVGILRTGSVDGRLLSLIHPTPAVNGYPRAAALNLIREVEPFDRGWYAGPVGWVGAGEAEFAVGIRSALITGEFARVYAGAGIVDGSEPEQEWAEIENKIAPMVAALSEAE